MTADERLPTANELPDGWTWTTLGEACQVNPRMSWPESFTDETPVSFVPMAAVDDVTGAIVAAKPRPISEVWRGYKRFAEGDVIFARITPCMENGKAAIATGLLNGIGLGSTEFHVLRPTEAALEKWVYHFVRQQSFRNEAARGMTGTAGQLRVPKSFMEKAFIPLPPRTEQQRIVAKIEALFAQSRRGREALDAVPNLLNKFRQAVLAAAFRGELTQRNPADEPASVLLERIRAERRRKWEEDLRAQSKDPSRRKYKEPAPPDTSDLPELPEGWRWVSLGQLLDRIDAGRSPRNQGRPAESEEFGVLKVSAVTWGEFLPEENKALLPGDEPGDTPTVKAGDLLISRANTTALVGSVVLVEQDYPNLMLSDKTLRLVPASEGILPKYLLYVLRAQWVRDYFARQATGTSDSMRNISQVKIRATPNVIKLADWLVGYCEPLVFG